MFGELLESVIGDVEKFKVGKSEGAEGDQLIVSKVELDQAFQLTLKCGKLVIDEGEGFQIEKLSSQLRLHPLD